MVLEGAHLMSYMYYFYFKSCVTTPLRARDWVARAVDQCRHDRPTHAGGREPPSGDMGREDCMGHKRRLFLVNTPYSTGWFGICSGAVAGRVLSVSTPLLPREFSGTLPAAHPSRRSLPFGGERKIYRKYELNSD